MVQTLLLIIGSYQYYSWPESPIKLFLLISVLDTEITPDQSLRYIYFSRSKCPILKLLLIRVSGANTTLEYRVLSKLLLTRVSDKYISLDRRARYRNYSWPESPINIFLLISVPDTEILPDQSLRNIYFSWSNCPILKLLLIRVSGANITFDYRVLSKILLTGVSDKFISLDRCARYRNYTWSESLVNRLLVISVPDTEITPDQSFWCKHYYWL